MLHNGQVVAIGMNQYAIQVIGVESFQAALHGAANVFRGEIEMAFTTVVIKLFADLGDNDPVLAPAHQLAETSFAVAVGGSGVDQVDAQVPGLGQQLGYRVVIRDGETIGVFHPLVAADFHRAQAECADG